MNKTRQDYTFPASQIFVKHLRAHAIAATLVLAMDPVSAAAQVAPFDTTDGQASFLTMSEYLTRDGGKWRAPNPQHDGSARSPEAFELWFDSHFSGRILQIQIVVQYADRTVVSSHGQWMWHPGAGELRYLVAHRGGAVTEGVTTFPNATTFVTLATRTGRNGVVREQRDDNVMVSPSLHRNETFRMEAGGWTSGGVFEWSRLSN